jgi:tetratricopeptide (TPR) repeat protein
MDFGRQALERLAAAHLVQPVRREDHSGGVTGGSTDVRYTFHDLLREYAAEQMAAEERQTAMAAARNRLLGSYPSTSDAVARLAYPHLLKLDRDPAPSDVHVRVFATADEGLSWVDAELDNLVAECRHAADAGPLPVAWQLADALYGYFWMRRRKTTWLATMHAALSAARRAGEQRVEADLLNRLGNVHWALSDYAVATGKYEASLKISRMIGWRKQEASTIGNLGGVYRELGRLEPARRCCLESVRVHREEANPLGEANGLVTLSSLSLDLGLVDDALDHASRALEMYRRLSVHDGQAATMLLLAECRLAVGEFDAAGDHAKGALDAFDEIGARVGRACALELMARADFERGRYEAGSRLLTAAEEAAEDADNGELDASLARTRAEGCLGVGDLVSAERYTRVALATAQRIGSQLSEIDALIRSAIVLTRSGRAPLALAPAERALTLAQSAQTQPRRAMALEALAESHTALDNRSVGERYRDEAAKIWQQTGCTPPPPLSLREHESSKLPAQPAAVSPPRVDR